MKTQKIYILVIIILLIVFIISCASFRSDIKGKFDQTPEKNYGAEKVNVLFIFKHLEQTVGYDAIPKLLDKRHQLDGFDDIFNDALNELTNIRKYATFTEYASDVNDPERRDKRDDLIAQHDYVLRIKFMKKKSFAKYFISSFLSTFSATLLPMPYTHSYFINVDVYNSKDILIKSYERKASLTKWVQTLLITLQPFHPEKRKEEEIYINFLHDIFRQIETEKLLTK